MTSAREVPNNRARFIAPVDGAKTIPNNRATAIAIHNMIAVDWGAGKKLATYPEEHMVERVVRSHPLWGKTEAEKFAWELQQLLEKGDVVLEASTIGSSGVEPELVKAAVKEAKNRLFVISGRAAKNFVGRAELEDSLSARVIYDLVRDCPDRARPAPIASSKYTRLFTTVRPSDKRGYADIAARSAFSVLPEHELQDKVAMPLGQAVIEFSLAGKKSYRDFERLIGLCAHGYPSHYRRATVDLMSQTAKRETGKKKNEEITRDERKQAWKATDSIVHRLFAERTRIDQDEAHQLARRIGKDEMAIRHWRERNECA